MMSYKEHVIMWDFCVLIHKIGLAPGGLNLLEYKYITPDIPKSTIYRFWNDGLC